MTHEQQVRWSRHHQGKINRVREALHKKEPVCHLIHGPGMVVEEWGTFIDQGKQVTGKGVFDVKFRDGKTRAINADHLFV